MNINDFLLNAKVGILDLKHSRPVSNKGTIEDIRKRTMASLRPPGFHTYANTGAGNAMASEPPKDKLEIDIEIVDEKKPVPAPEPPAEKPTKPMLGGEGGKQSKESIEQIEEKKSEEAVEPSAQPPFNLSDPKDKADYDAYVEYYNKRYGKKVAKPDIDKLKKDSEGYTLALKAYLKLQDDINSFNRNDAKRWSEWFNNVMVKFGDTIIEGLALGASTVFPENKAIIDNIKDFSKKFVPKNARDAVNGLKQIQKDLFAGKPSWSKKLNIFRKDAFDKFMKKLEDEIGGIDDSIMN